MVADDGDHGHGHVDDNVDDNLDRVTHDGNGGHLGAILWPYWPFRGRPKSILCHLCVATSEVRRCMVAFAGSLGHLGAILESP